VVAIASGPEQERRRGRRFLRYTLWGTLFSLVLALGSILAIDLATTENVTPLWYGWAVIGGVTVGLGLAPLIALAQDDGEESRLHQQEAERARQAQP
jgi:hypothetical protein